MHDFMLPVRVVQIISPIMHICCQFVFSTLIAISALTLFVGYQEERSACKKVNALRYEIVYACQRKISIELE